MEEKDAAYAQEQQVQIQSRTHATRYLAADVHDQELHFGARAVRLRQPVRRQPFGELDHAHQSERLPGLGENQTGRTYGLLQLDFDVGQPVEELFRDGSLLPEESRSEQRLSGKRYGLRRASRGGRSVSELRIHEDQQYAVVWLQHAL